MSRFWGQHAKTIDLTRFRAHDQYVSQPNSYHYEGIWRHLMQEGECDRMRAMGEDGSHGCRVERIGDWKVSRDLLDSLLEIRFLERNLPRFGVRTLLDIGAGYGRLAWRLQQTHPELEVTCTDDVNVSRDACATYRSYRRGHWSMTMEPETYDVAVNIHSWPECTTDEVADWLTFLLQRRVPWLFVIPHDAAFSNDDAYDGGVNDRLADREGREFRSVIEAHTYRECAYQELFGRHYYLFRLAS